MCFKTSHYRSSCLTNCLMHHHQKASSFSLALPVTFVSRYEPQPHSQPWGACSFFRSEGLFFGYRRGTDSKRTWWSLPEAPSRRPSPMTSQRNWSHFSELSKILTFWCSSFMYTEWARGIEAHQLVFYSKTAFRLLDKLSIKSRQSEMLEGMPTTSWSNVMAVAQPISKIEEI